MRGPVRRRESRPIAMSARTAADGSFSTDRGEGRDPAARAIATAVADFLGRHPFASLTPGLEARVDARSC